MRFRNAVAALMAGALLAGSAGAQTLQNGDFETPNLSDPSRPLGWAPFNNARYRVVGDGLTPAALTRSGTASIELPSGVDFNGYTSDALLGGPLSARNNPAVAFPDVGPGSDFEVSGWYAIPADMPLANGARSGLKLEFRRANNSIFAPFELANITGTTNGQFVRFALVVTDTQLRNLFVQFPPGPVSVSILPFRVGAEGTGTIFWDDIAFGPVGGGDPCPADFDDSGTVDVADIFAFLSAWFASGPGSDFNGSGATDVADIFAFLSAWFAGCP